LKKMLLLVALIVSFAFVSETAAIQKPAPSSASAPPEKSTIEKMERFSGVIEKVDEKGKMIVVRGKRIEDRTLPFTIDDKTKIVKGEVTMILGDLKKGMEVSIDYKREAERLIAIVIRVFVPKEAPERM
jgi:hypothetical protein